MIWTRMNLTMATRAAMKAIRRIGDRPTRAARSYLVNVLPGTGADRQPRLAPASAARTDGITAGTAERHERLGLMALAGEG